MKLNELSANPAARKKRKRLGRGNGSGLGTTSGRGSKGQGSRSGGGVRPGYEGGQMPIHRRLPKRGFVNIFKKDYAIVNLSQLDRFESGAVIDRENLVAQGLIKSGDKRIKILGKGEISMPLTIAVDRVSKTAREKIEAAGGSISESLKSTEA